MLCVYPYLHLIHYSKLELDAEHFRISFRDTLQYIFFLFSVCCTGLRLLFFLLTLPIAQSCVFGFEQDGRWGYHLRSVCCSFSMRGQAVLWFGIDRKKAVEGAGESSQGET